MKVFLGIVLALTCVTAEQSWDELLSEINSKPKLWTAGVNFDGIPISNLTYLLGGMKVPEDIEKTVPILEHQIDPAAIPESFDARYHWNNCRTIKEIRNQGGCGSCWAVAAASVMSDRHCVHSGGRVQPELSGRYVTACDKLSIGCGGGQAYNALILWRDHGVVTGGEYGSNYGCQPYPFHMSSNGSTPASSIQENTPQCVNRCDNPALDFNKELYHGRSMYRVTPQNEAQIQADIMANGPVTAGMTGYADIFAYKGGVYHHTTDKIAGGHIVRIVGWGQQYGQKYWWVANSWSANWGEQGMIKILRGVNECGIEEDIYAGIPQ